MDSLNMSQPAALLGHVSSICAVHQPLKPPQNLHVFQVEGGISRSGMYSCNRCNRCKKSWCSHGVLNVLTAAVTLPDADGMCE